MLLQLKIKSFVYRMGVAVAVLAGFIYLSIWAEGLAAPLTTATAFVICCIAANFIAKRANAIEKKAKEIRGMEKGIWKTAQEEAAKQYADLSIEELQEKRYKLEDARRRLKPFNECVKECTFSTVNVHFTILGKIAAIDELIGQKRNVKKSNVEQMNF